MKKVLFQDGPYDGKLQAVSDDIGLFVEVAVIEMETVIIPERAAKKILGLSAGPVFENAVRQISEESMTTEIPYSRHRYRLERASVDNYYGVYEGIV